MKTPGMIIFLNGTSSSGKTCLLEALQERLDPLYLNMGIDKFIWMLPERFLERPLWDDVLGLADRAGENGHHLMTTMHHAIAAAARRGSNILADHVLVERSWVAECARLFHTLPAWLIGVRCELSVLEERERSRKNRTLGQARAQYECVHAHGVYDFEVDTAHFSSAECADQIVVYLQSRSQPHAFRQLYMQKYH
ncbi:MAG TPA: zeta toxin family protein [Anaerolineaceae bacterium]|nr:zeta toxin family protein [Anaerolineaceae bacterium]